METLSVLGIDITRLRLMRFFVLHAGGYIDIRTLAEKMNMSLPEIKKHIHVLLGASYIQKKQYVKKTTTTKGIVKSEKKEGYGRKSGGGEEGDMLDELLLRTDTLSTEALRQRFKKIRHIDLALLSGVFVRNSNTETDIVVVGTIEKIKDKVEKEIQTLEQECGIDIRYAVFDTEDFIYRYKMYDRFVTDIVSDTRKRIIVDTQQLH